MKQTRLSAAPGWLHEHLTRGAASCPRWHETAGTASQLIASVLRTLRWEGGRGALMWRAKSLWWAAVAGIVPLTAGACVVHHTHDYILGITCAVVDPSGTPVDGAEVVLTLRPAAYRATEAVGEERQLTTHGHGVAFVYATHVGATGYGVTVRKRGYVTAEAAGIASSGAAGTHLRVVLVPGGDGQ